MDKDTVEQIKKQDAPIRNITPEIADAALQLLQRVQLQGSEVQTYVVVLNALNAEKLAGLSDPPPTE